MKRIRLLRLIMIILIIGCMSLIGCSNREKVNETGTITKEEISREEVNKEEVGKEKTGEKIQVDEAKPAEITDPINIATLNGPTGIGMVNLMNKENSLFAINTYQAPDEIVGKVVSGEIDIACVPSNLAAVLYNKTQGGIKLLGTNTLGVLYLLEKGKMTSNLEDIKGKVILASGKGSTPEFILNSVLLANGINPEQDVTIEYMANHADVVSAFLADEGDKIALLAEPHVTTAMTKGENISIAIDINEEWKKVESTDLPMGVIIVSKEFAETRKEDLDIFINEYKESVEFVNTNVDEAAKLVANYKIVPNEEIAKQAIPKCNIVFKDAQESKQSLNKFYEIISKLEPKSVGGKLPDEDFYLN